MIQLPEVWTPRWFPLGARMIHGCPNVGQIVALDHTVWRVVDVQPLAAEHWNDTERLYARGGKRMPMAVQLRPIDLCGHPDPVMARSRDRHVGSLRVHTWHGYDDEHYPVCRECAEPMPCRATLARREGEAAIRKLGRYETAGVCPACQEVVTPRQRSLTFSENLEVPGGPPVTIHLRGRCRGEAITYEKRWVAADPQRRRPTLSCPGRVTNHNDGTYDCTEMGDCPSPAAHHRSYTMCRCPDCHSRPWTWGRGCGPDPAARLNLGDAA